MESETRVVALGFFDGVHIGHGALLRRVAQRARELGALPAAVTFDRPPRQLTAGTPVPLINTVEDRESIMRERYGVREVQVLPFDRAMMEMPWDRFVTRVLRDRLGAVHVVAGHDYRFGHQGEGDPQKLKDLCGQLGMGCDIMGRVELDGVTVSSTHIRGLLEAGEMETACRFLGHPHILSGQVVHGRRLGRTIGIPTANLIVPEGVLVPAFGVYASQVLLESGERRPAVTNVGVRPTVDDSGRVTVEPWILDYDGQLYGRAIRVEFYRQLRPERRFSSLDELRDAILRNAEETRDYFKNHGASS